MLHKHITTGHHSLNQNVSRCNPTLAHRNTRHPAWRQQPHSKTDALTSPISRAVQASVVIAVTVVDAECHTANQLLVRPKAGWHDQIMKPFLKWEDFVFPNCPKSKKKNGGRICENYGCESLFSSPFD